MGPTNPLVGAFAWCDSCGKPARFVHPHQLETWDANTCVCTDWCGEDENPCPVCVRLDPYLPCPVVGYGDATD